MSRIAGRERDAQHADTLQLVLTAEQGNLVITALAECAFKLVYELIGKLNRQANAAMQAGDTYACLVGAAELKLILEALGKLPYQQVHALVHELQRQLQQQLDGAARMGKTGKTGRKAGKR
ncbi:hypothetical protein [Herbaspirillum sp. RV1423]|uniref:hypothetical protein n=1 Tax=Herbaspirillum sp. RV1423 TaxID=1443993 RepID=UPI0004BA8A2C|nr:hypothetical protein [Herbaspirillum sp. RV1423]